MNKSCEMYQMELMDVHYGESKMTGELRNHLDICEDCSRYWAGLGELETSMAFPELEDPFKEIVLDKLMAERDNKTSLRRNAREFAAFLLLAALFLGTCLALVFSGHAIALSKIYLSIFMVSPLMLPFLIKRQTTKGAHTNGRA
ncbi:MAG TPA: hypothetical protein VJ990_03365 [Clostridia bacterium]|nr:hypothetical protein [Clostridia bacterium]